MAVLVIGATLFIMAKVAVIFDIPPELVSQSRLVILLVGISIAAAFPMGIFSEALAGGLWRYDLFNKVSLVMAFLQTALTIFLLERGWGLPGLGVSVLTCSALGYLWRMRLLFRLLPDLSIRPRWFSLATLRQIGDYTVFSFILVLSGRVAFYSDSFIVGIFRGVEEVAIFGIGVKLTEYLRQLIFTLTKLFSPVASRYDPDLDKATLRRVFYTGSRLHLLFSLPLSLGLFFWGRPLIHLWIGESFDYSATVLQVLLIGHICAFMQGIGGEILLGVGRHKRFAILSLIAALGNIGLSIVLVKKLGLIGVAWGTTIPLAILSLGYVPAATLKLVEGGFSEFIRRVFVPAAAAAVPAGAVIIYASGRLGGYLDFGLWLATVLAVYCPAGWFWGLTGAEREKIRGGISQYFG